MAENSQTKSSSDGNGTCWLKCQKCGALYLLGIDSQIVSLGAALDFMAGQGTAIVGNVGGMLASTPDLVAPIPSDVDDKEERIASTLVRANEIIKNLAVGHQSPQWTCHNCKTDQSYPRDFGKASAPSSEQRSGCFIATAACGDENAWEVIALRRFRDEVMLSSRFGRFLVACYYQLSPPIARLIGKNRILRNAVRRWFIKPLARRLGKFTNEP